MINYIVECCAPTLAQLKVANLFSYPYFYVHQLQQELINVNEVLNKVNLFAELLKLGEKRALIYVYQKEKLKEVLNRCEVKCFLEEIGYVTRDLETCLSSLKMRLMSHDEFPHEIGFFLGYPYEDVIGFIHHQGKEYLYKGYWKVYGHLDETKKLFQLYLMCKEEYRLKYEQGQTLQELLMNI
ncbi:MAG: DUF3793 family protein [Turicibacter sp.]|nr:DUF3793 family protein [Turicibacter sp.]